MTDTTANHRVAAQNTVFAVLFAIGFCHALNDMMQSLLQAIYPNLKDTFELDFTHIGLITLVYQLTASLLQPLVGAYTDKHPLPYALPVGMLFTFVGLLLLAEAPSYALLLAGAAIVGIGSSTFHPESSRMAHAAAGPRRGLAQSMFQVGGSIGGALGPLLAAFVVTRSQRTGVAYFSALALLASAILYFVASWYRTHGAARAAHHARTREAHGLPPLRVRAALAILVMLIFSKFVYLASLTSYYTFYLIHHFGLTVQHAQLFLFLFLGSVAVGTISGGPLGDRFGRKYLIWFSILGTLPFSLALPAANLFWTGVLSVGAGLVLSSAFHAMVVFGQELLPGRVGMISGLFFGLSFGMGGIGAAALGALADREGIEFVYRVCAFLPALGLLAAFLPNLGLPSHPVALTTEPDR
ncbi:MAG TPA: MFS transporter [Rhizomicrobium sp.]|jgi:FSR family fosmidomycin resistance protein-like MFS transporter